MIPRKLYYIKKKSEKPDGDFYSLRFEDSSSKISLLLGTDNVTSLETFICHSCYSRTEKIAKIVTPFYITRGWTDTS